MQTIFSNGVCFLLYQLRDNSFGRLSEVDSIGHWIPHTTALVTGQVYCTVHTAITE